MNEKGKQALKAAQERIAAQNEREQKFFEEVVESLPPPQPLPEGQAGKARKFPLTSPLYYSQDFLEAVADLPLPIPSSSIKGQKPIGKNVR